MLAKQSHLLQPLNALTSKKVKFKWTYVEQKASDEIKWIVNRDTLLIYPDLNKCFGIHTDASQLQLVAVISEYGKTIVFYSRKITKQQQRYKATENKLLSIVETLKEFYTILLGQRIKIYTDHTNLTWKTSTLIECYDRKQHIWRWKGSTQGYSYIWRRCQRGG